MGNQQLIKGAYMGPQHAGIANFYLNSIAGKKGYPYRNYGSQYPRIPYRNMQNFLNTNQQEYIDNLPAGYAVEKLPGSMRPGVTAWSKQQQIEAGNWNRRMKTKGVEPGSTAWITANAGLQTIKNQFKNVSANLDAFQALKTEFLEDFDNKTISEGSDTDSLKMLFSTDDFQYDIQDGQIYYTLPDDSVIGGNKLPKYFNKNSDGANKLITLNETAYKQGRQWDKPTEDHYRRQVKNIVREKGREGLLSLATDDFLDEPIITKDSPNGWLLEEENHDALEQFVIDRYVQGMMEASNVAYNNKQQKTSVNTGGDVSGILDAATADQYYGENLGEIVNALPLGSGRRVETFDDGTFDLYYRSAPNAPEELVGSKIDPTNPAHKAIYYRWLGISSTTGIDTNRI